MCVCVRVRVRACSVYMSSVQRFILGQFFEVDDVTSHGLTLTSVSFKKRKEKKKRKKCTTGGGGRGARDTFKMKNFYLLSIFLRTMTCQLVQKHMTHSIRS